ncbi:MAG: hypothetical protein A3G93_00470 [Nitrospinae bacterium RIFCSPLOWO2_12_FULL_45_22]|nr:MAG: hypothetical protein A3G93_00470 [Nitrospinae bacterium RIFCSPLOWO2_12_FULL_45_22]
MFRILIVEDIELTLEQLEKTLSEEFPQSTIDTAETVKEGLERIEAAVDKGQHYHAAVLDFKLPEDKGKQDEVDESLCEKIRHEMPDIIVAHISAYPGDPKIQDHVKNYHLDRRDSSAALISKDEVDWPSELVKKLKEFLYGTRIEEQINNLFRKQPVSAYREPIYRRRTGTIGNGSVTHELAALFRDILENWTALDDRLRTRIMSLFRVDTSSDPIRIGLIKDIDAMMKE